MPRLVAAPIVVFAALAATAGAAYSLLDDAVDVVESLPSAARHARQVVTAHAGRSAGAVKEAAEELGTGTGKAGPASPIVDGDSVIERVVSTTFAAAGEAVVIVFLVLFLVIARHRMRARLIEMAGPEISRRQLTSRIIDDIEQQVQRFLVVLLSTAIVVGVSTWLALVWIGAEHAAVWGILAGVFNSIPYFGPVMVSVGLLAAGLVQSGDVTQALLMSGAAVVITSLEGWLLTPVLLGKVENLNALTVFVGLMLWTWLWGAWWTVLAVPMLVIMKSTADHVPALHRVGRLMAP